MPIPTSRAVSAVRGGQIRMPPALKSVRPSVATAAATAATATPMRFVSSVSSRSAITSMSLPSTPLSTSPMSVSRLSLASMNGSTKGYSPPASPALSRASTSPLLFRRRLATASESSMDMEEVLASPPGSGKATPVPVIGAEPVRAVLKDTARLLADDIGGSAEWYHRVLAAESDLAASRRRRLAVIGDELAAPHDIVSAVLQDPLADSDTMRRALLDRYYGTGTGTLRIEYSETPSRTEGKLTCPAGWLQATKCDVIEVEAGGPRDAVVSTLVSSDAICIVLDPIRLADAPVVKDVLPLALAKGKVQIIVNGAVPAHITEASLRSKLDKQIAEVVAPGLHGPKEYDVTFVRAERALQALESLSSALSGTAAKGPAIEAFQRDYVASNLSPLPGAFASALPADAQLVTAANAAHLALAYVDGVIASDRAVLDKTRRVVRNLRSEANEGTAKARRLSLVARGIEGGVVEGSVEQSVSASRKDIEHLFASRFSWLSLLARLRVDDVGTELSAYLNRSFARDMETQLIFEAGELAQLQTSLGDKSNETARTLSIRGAAKAKTPGAGHPFSSPVLLNHLESLALSIPPVTPTSLLGPVNTRRAQLLSTAVPRLQVSAQRSLLTTYALAFAGISSSWCLCVPPLSIFSTSTSIATGALALVGSLALGQALWAKAQKRWWRDWTRVTDMLKDDLAANYDKTVDALVLARPNVAADGLDELVTRRETRLDDLATKVKTLHARIVQTGDLGDEK